MADWQVEITVNGDPGLAIDTNTGLPQGSPVSPVLFLIYIADLASLVEATVNGAVALSFVDDVTWIVDGTDDADVTGKLDRCAETCLAWARDNTVCFEEDKTEAILFSRCREHRRELEVTVSVGNHVAPYNINAIRWLGYWLDPRLTFNHHHQKWLTKARQQQARISRLCRRQGLPPASAANLQKAVVQSIATYGIELNAARRLPSRDVGWLANLQKVLNQ
jgi:hypothetical protein